MNHEQTEQIRILKAKKGAEFDKAYVDAMAKNHPKDISLFEDRAQSSKDPQIKAFAEQSLPILQEHLNAVRGLQKVR
jgi:putative membrane protein